MINFSDVSNRARDTRYLVLLALLKLSGGGSGLCVDATIENIKEVLKQDYARERTRERIKQILDEFESQGFIYGEKGLLSDGRLWIYGIHPYKIGQELFTIIKDSDKAVVYGDKYAGMINDYDTLSLYKIEHDLPDELDEVYDKLKIKIDDFFNRDPPSIETDKVRGFDDWGPDSQKLIENLENALWTWARV